MKIERITDLGATGTFYIGNSEIFIVHWNNGGNPIFYSFDHTKVVREVSKQHFAIQLYGKNYLTIERSLPKPIEFYMYSKDDEGNIFLCFYQDSIVYQFNSMGELLLEWSIDDIGDGHSIYDIEFEPPSYLWMAFPSGHTVSRVSLQDKKEAFRFGNYTWEDITEPLNFPESIFRRDDNLYISNMGNGELLSVNLRTRNITHVATFTDSIWQYGETTIGKFIITDKGLYEIKNAGNTTS